jgi:hypothetical protein
MPAELPEDLKPVLEACKSVPKSDTGEFSYKWLRSCGNTFHHSKLMQLVNRGFLAVEYNGIIRRGTAWYRLSEVG